MNITALRPANAEDINALVQLVNSAYHPAADSGGWTDESRFVLGTRTSAPSLAKLLGKEDSVILLGLHEDHIIASIQVEKSAGCAHIGMLAVNPAWQCQGLGKQMLAEAENYACRHFQVNQFELIVISLREELIAFYLRRGYRNTGQTIAYTALCGDTCDAKIDGMKFAVLAKSV